METIKKTAIDLSQSSYVENWLDQENYPFRNRQIQLTCGNMHYVDEGEGEVILFVHGTPTWSFLYRDYIIHFRKTHRCVAIDHIGFGLSEKPLDFDGKPKSHATNLTEFIEKLELKNITLVVHDFGGPIGLSAAIKHHEKFKRIIMFNTWLWETASNPDAQKVYKVLNSWMGRFLYLNMNFSPKFLLKKSFYNKKKLSKNIHQQYINPFPDKSSRLSLLNLGKSLVGSSDWYKAQGEKLSSISDKPWLILWGMKDEFIKPDFLDK